MKSDFNRVRKIPVGTVCTSISDTFKGNAQQVVLVNTSDVLEGKVLNHQSVPNKNLRGQFKKTFCKEDILYSEIRPQNKRFAFVDFSPCNYIASTKLMVLRADQQQILPRYLYYFLTSNPIIAELQMLAETRSGTFPQITFSELANITIPVPLLDVQQSIVDIVKCIDDKIELNQKINENLERQMQTLYQNLLAENDCTLVRLEELASKIAMGPFGANIKVSTFVPSGVPIISGNHLRSFFLEEPSYNYITEEHAQRLKNSMVFPKDIIFTHAGNIGQVAMIPEGCDYPYYMISQRQFYVRCDKSKVIPEIVLFFFHSIEGKGKLLANANSTGVPSIAQPSTHLKNIEMPLPAKEVQDKWYNVVRPMVRCYVSLCQENKRLVKIRDTLLPKLMAGEIDL